MVGLSFMLIFYSYYQSRLLDFDQSVGFFSCQAPKSDSARD